MLSNNGTSDGGEPEFARGKRHGKGTKCSRLGTKNERGESYDQAAESSIQERRTCRGHLSAKKRGADTTGRWVLPLIGKRGGGMDREKRGTFPYGGKPKAVQVFSGKNMRDGVDSEKREDNGVGGKREKTRKTQVQPGLS